MVGEHLSITTRPEVIPVARHKPYRVPKHWQVQVREGVGNDVRMGITEKVPVNTPTT